MDVASAERSRVSRWGDLRIAVVLPCLNEEAAIAAVVRDFAAALPEAQIHVIDNASTDATAERARLAGAIVIDEPVRGKGNAVRRSFTAVDADIYIIADGDGTYDAARAPELVTRLLGERLDMVIGARHKVGEDAYRRGHEWGNRLFNRLLRGLFGSSFRDIFSGYRVLSRRFVLSFPAMSEGFEIETEMSVHAILLHMPTREIETDYKDRHAGTASKLKTYRDGWRIMLAMATLMRHHRPLAFFFTLSGGLLVGATGLFAPLFVHWLETGLVPRIPTLILSVALFLAAMLGLVCGLILDSTARMQVEIRRLLYLNSAPLPGRDPPREGA
jgi:glycosyltransferase involved in cell wall biosynthesis